MKLAAFPKCFMDQLVVDHTMSVFDWIAMAAELPVDGLEMYSGFLENFDPAYLARVREAIEARGLDMPMFCCSPDFTSPDERDQRREIEIEKKMIGVTAALGGRFCRVLSGQRRPEVSRAQGVKWVSECLRELVDFAADKNVVLALENHYKDNYWRHPEFAQKSDVFIEILSAVPSPWLGAQFDPSNTILAGEDPIDLLQKIKGRVVTMHASDRRLKPGHSIEELRLAEDSMGYAAILSHGVIGSGLNDFPKIFSILKSAGFDGWVSIEDGVNGLDEIRQSAEFLLPFIRGARQ
ncbi:MAG: sugar phosphate isomerase/epimerase [Acidobacteriota bacterium]|nr:sugar phosphate isomerase/epimerase [Acidobacteriota bacterium]